MISLSLPYPPTTNNLYRNTRGKGRVKTQRYLTWLRAAGNEVLMQRQKPIAGYVVLNIQLGKPDKRKRDLSNLIKACEDLLVQHGLIEDDSMVAKLTIQWNPYLQKGACKVDVWPAVIEMGAAA